MNRKTPKKIFYFVKFAYVKKGRKMFVKDKIIEDILDRITALEDYRERNWELMDYTRRKFDKKFANLIMFTQKAIVEGKIEHEYINSLGGYHTEYTISYVGKVVKIRKDVMFLPTGLNSENYYISIDNGTEIKETIEDGDIQGLFNFADKTYGARKMKILTEREENSKKQQKKDKILPSGKIEK